MQFDSLVITATLCAIWTTLVTVFSKFLLIFVISMIEVSFIPILRQFYGIPILVICATLRAVWTTLATVFSKIMSLFIISMFEIGITAILRQLYVT